MTAVNWSNVTDLGQIPAAANTASNGTFWVAMLYMLWIVLIFMFIGFGWEVAILSSSFLALVLGLLLVYTGLISFQTVLVFVGVILFMFLYIIWTSKKKT